MGQGVSLPLLLINAAYTSFINICIQLPLRLPKMQDQESLTCRWLSFSGFGSECIPLVFEYNGNQYIGKWQRYSHVNISWLAIGYLNVTTNRKTGKPETEIGTKRSSQTRQNPQVDGNGSWFAPARCSGLGFWMGFELNQTVLVVRTRTTGWLPGPVSNSRQARRRCWCLVHYWGNLYSESTRRVWRLRKNYQLDTRNSEKIRWCLACSRGKMSVE